MTKGSAEMGKMDENGVGLIVIECEEAKSNRTNSCKCHY